MLKNPLVATAIVLGLQTPLLYADTTIETITVTASRVEQPLAQVSSSIAHVANTDLATVNHQHIHEALRRIPGTWVSRGNGQEHLTAIRSPVFTGGGSCGAFYMAEDGVALRSLGFCNVNQLFDVNSEQAERIEVLRGPGTTSHSSDALHGVINVISRAPGETAETTVAVEGGPHNYSRIKLSTSNRYERHAYRLSVHGTHDSGFKDDSGFDQQKLSYRHDYNGNVWSLQNLLSLSNLNQNTAGFVQGKDVFKDKHRLRENAVTAAGNPQPYRDTRSLRFQTRAQRDLGNNGNLVLTPYLRDTDMAFWQHFLPGTPLEENGHTAVGLQSYFTQPVSAGLDAGFGIDLELTRAFLKQTQQAATFTRFGTTFAQGAHYDYDVNATLYAVFADASWRPGAATTVNIGSRYESIHYDYNNNTSAGNSQPDGTACRRCRYTRPASRSDNFNYWSANIGLVQTINQQLSLFVNANSGNRAPQATELYRLQSGQTVAALQPEELHNIELGLRGSNGPVSYSFASFLMQKNNVIFQNAQRQNISGGKTRHSGLELEFNWQINQQFTLAYSGSYARHKYDNSVRPQGTSATVDINGNDIDTAPRLIQSARLQWQYAAASQAELAWEYLGSYYLETANAHEYEGHKLWHLRLQHQLLDQLAGAVRIHNLLDEHYADRADYAFGNYRYFIGEPRAVFIELRYTL